MSTTQLNQIKIVQDAQSQGLGVVVNPEIDREIMHQMVAWLVQSGPVTVLDCGCSFDANRVMELIHLNTIFFRETMERIQVARAFTVYQFVTLLEETQSSQTPLFIMNPLNLFYDDNITTPEATRLYSICSEHIMRMSKRGPIVVSARPPAEPFQDRVGLLHHLCKGATQLITQRPAQPAARQLSLI